jgi:hypothetical protein
MASAGDLFGGGGVSELDLVAGENLTVGDPVSLGTDGKAYKSIGLLNNSTAFANPLPLAEATKYFLDTVANKIIALGVNSADNDKLYTSVGTVSASGALTWGAVTTHTMGSGIGGAGVVWDAVRQSSDQLFLAYSGAIGDLRCRIINYSGTTTTVGTEVSLAVTNVTSSVVMNLVADSTGRVLIAWFRNTSTFTLWGSRATVSGTTITLGAETQITLSQSANYINNQRIEMLYDSTQDRVVLAVMYHRGISNTPFYVDLILVNIATTVSTVATTNVQPSTADNSSFTNLEMVISRISGTSSYAIRFAHTLNTTGSSNDSRFRLFTVSTTAFTLGTEVTLSQNANTMNTNWVEDTVNNKIIFGYDSSGCQVFTRSGTTLTLQRTDTNIDFASALLNFITPYVVGRFNSLQQIYDFSATIPRRVGTLSVHTDVIPSQSRLLTTVSGITYSIEREAGAKLGSSIQRHLISRKLTNEDQIGVSTQTVSSGATAKIALRFNKTSPAKIVTGLSGLVPGIDYYVTVAGTRDVAGIAYLGYAKSATELVLANPDGAET